VKPHSLFVWVLLEVLAVCNLCPGDTIVLKEGQRLTGNILAEKQTQLIVDIGVTVLTIKKDDILEYEYSRPAEPEGPDVNQPEVQSRRPLGQLYHTGKRSQTTIEECADEFSEAVLKVSSPAGMGSGFFINEEGYLITNHHVIEKETKIEVTMFRKAKDGFEKKKFSKVKIEAINPFVDLALMKV
jgi:serine protease Do